MQDWKTTVTALVGAGAMLLAHFGLNLGPEVQTGIVAVVVIVLGYLTKDKGTP